MRGSGCGIWAVGPSTSFGARASGAGLRAGGAGRSPGQVNKRGPGRGRRRSGDPRGFMLVDVLISTLVFAVGMLATAQLLIFTTEMRVSAQRQAESSRLAQAKFDELMKVNFGTDPRMAITPANVDSLGTNVNNYFDVPTPGVVTRRWRVRAGPTADTRVVTVRVVNMTGSLGARTVEISTILRQW